LNKTSTIFVGHAKNFLVFRLSIVKMSKWRYKNIYQRGRFFKKKSTICWEIKLYSKSFSNITICHSYEILVSRQIPQMARPTLVYIFLHSLWNMYVCTYIIQYTIKLVGIIYFWIKSTAVIIIFLITNKVHILNILMPQ